MYSPKKNLQMIGYLLSLNGGKMNLLKMMKELYLIDRESISERDCSVSGDVFFSLKHGPILSMTKNLLDDLNTPDNIWKDFLTSESDKYYSNIILKQNTGSDRLSSKEEGYIRKIFEQYKDKSEWELEDFTHNLPEWTFPGESSKKVRFRDIMLALGKSEEEIEYAKQEYDQMNNLHSVLENMPSEK